MKVLLWRLLYGSLYMKVLVMEALIWRSFYEGPSYEALELGSLYDGSCRAVIVWDPCSGGPCFGGPCVRSFYGGHCIEVLV